MCSTFIINLKARTDRKLHIKREFANRSEFEVTIIEAVENKIGSIGLWQTIKKIVNESIVRNLDYILICEDDHQFTEHYTYNLLKESIEEAKKKDADILCGGLSWFDDAFPVSENLFWLKKFSGLQFTVIFKKFYDTILNADFGEHDAADYKMSTLSCSKYFIHPFISIQKEFGYSDVTPKNNGTDRVEELFATTEKNASIIRHVYSFYRNLEMRTDNEYIDLNNILIPVYIINLPEKTERRKHIINQFAGKKEFDITIINACKHVISAVGLWQSIRKVIQLAIDKDDDVIIISEDNHEFTSDYSKAILFKNIIEAHMQGCEYLNCGTSKFDFAVPIGPNRFWTNHCLSTQFIVLYRKFFRRILDEPFDEAVVADIKLSEMTDQKMILYPSLSTKHNPNPIIVNSNLTEAVTKNISIFQERLNVLSHAIDNWSQSTNILLK